MVLLINLARVVFAPLLKELMVEFSINEGTAGLLATMVWVGSALPRVPAGWLLTRVARHRVVLWTGVVLSGSALLTAGSNSVVTLSGGALLMGTASGVYFVAANPLVSELYPRRVGWAMGVHGTASQVAAVVAAPFVTLALLFDWRTTFLAIGVAAAVVTVALYLAARRASLPNGGSRDRDLVGAAMSEWRLITLGVVVLGFAGFVWQGLFTFYELYMVQKGLSDAAAKNMLTVVFAAGVPAFYLGGRFADRLPYVPYLLGNLLAFVASVLLLTVSGGLVALFAVTAVLGYLIHSLFIVMDAFILATLPGETRASAYAVYSGGMMLAQAAGSTAVGAAVARGATYDAVFAGLAGVLGIVALGLCGLRSAGRLPT
ncbi:MFS transporter [Halegenticoccus tardaugens]|uniref:MFS transporter n=1 Tax=Halegenticoccus tardaugens TaxID=2071624 RepID=UPI00100A73CE|nr:MFS transporter [Halegenticoccus tardaugens]